MAFYLGSLIDFRREQPVRLVTRRTASPEGNMLGALAGLFAFGGLVADVALIFPHLQNAESGEFDFSGLAVTSFADSFWLSVVIVTAATVAIVTVLMLARRRALRAAQ